MKAATKRRVLDFSMIGVFVALLISLRMNLLVHIVLGVAMVILVIIHLVLNRTWLSSNFRKIKVGSFKMTSKVGITMIIAAVFLVVTISGLFALQTSHALERAFGATSFAEQDFGEGFRNRWDENEDSHNWRDSDQGSQSRWSSENSIFSGRPFGAGVFHGRPFGVHSLHVWSGLLFTILFVIHLSKHWKFLVKRKGA